MATDDGGVAFPSLQRVCLPGTDRAEFALVGGMSLRDWFASMAIAYLRQPIDGRGLMDYAQSATWAYDIADAMIAEKRRREAKEAESDG